MKIMKGKTIALAVVCATAMFASCSEETELTPGNDLDQASLSPENLSRFEALGFDVNNIRVEDYSNPLDPAANSAMYLIDNDMWMSQAQLEDITDGKEYISPNGEQYRTTNLVTNNRTYSVIGYTGSCCALTSKMRTALQWSVNNFNRLNTGLRFSLSFSASTNADMVVYNNGASGGGGSAGFPSSSGAPNKFIQINAGTDAFSTNVNEHVITHEMGHSVGFRHTDYFNRSLSCGSGGNEGSAGVGAILIPGTPSGTDTNSIMQACFSSNEDGEFGNFDIVAMEFMY